MNLLVVSDLTVQIDRKTIIENVSFELAPRERLSILDQALASILSLALGLAINHYYPRLTIGDVTINLALEPTVISVVTLLFVFSFLRKKI
jgi:hypothetical protein